MSMNIISNFIMDPDIFTLILIWSKWIAAVATAVGIIYQWVVKPICSKVHEFTDKFNDLPERLAAVEQGIKDITHEVQPNSGKSMKDVVLSIRGDLTLLRHRLDLLVEHDRFGHFLCDMNGNNLHVNNTYAIKLHTTKDKLLGLGWKSYITPERITEYDQVWGQAFRERREFTYKIQYRDANLNTVYAIVNAYPIKVLDEVKAYMGVVNFEVDHQPYILPNKESEELDESQKSVNSR